MEIERKFDIKNIPSWMKEKSVRHKKIEQIYLMIDFDNDGKVLEEIRVRKAINLKTNQVDYKMTYKYGDGLSREEIETPISADFYLAQDHLLLVARQNASVTYPNRISFFVKIFWQPQLF